LLIEIIENIIFLGFSKLNFNCLPLGKKTIKKPLLRKPKFSKKHEQSLRVDLFALDIPPTPQKPKKITNLTKKNSLVRKLTRLYLKRLFLKNI
tara:strand:+ start:251 stop:529 length:279 start_codon:yes stop_codon:yes gene_type:complete